MKSKILTYRTIIKKDGKYYHGYAPSLRGCHTQGDTVEETQKNLREAIEGWLEYRIENGMTIPEPDYGLESTEIIDMSKLKVSKPVLYA